MSDIAIRVEHLGKRYRIGGQQARYRTLRESLVAAARVPWDQLRGLRPGRERYIWALEDVCFEVKCGEAIGIIGRNGAGKSTLLKILSRITKPTSGRVEIRGRVSSLLEVGTGFHPELTGRENIFLNGAILGMKRQEIARKFDEIVAFSEIERFLDTPVKYYSSGMYLRLAFAVAAHLEPEVLVVDEVLAVGDARFQRKCLDKMEDVGMAGRTVLFVSHDMAAITRLCPRAVLLDEGRVLADGPSSQVIGVYMGAGLGARAVREWPTEKDAPGDSVVRLRKVRVITDDGITTDSVDIRRPVGIEVHFHVLEPGHILVPNLHFVNEEGQIVFIVHDTDPAWRRRPRDPGPFISTAWIPGNFLAEGRLFVGVAISTHYPIVVHCFERDAVTFQVIDSPDGDSARADYAGPMPGIVRPMLKWTTEMRGSDHEPALQLTARGET